MQRVIRIALALLLVVLVAGADHDDHDGHDHGEEMEGHEGHGHAEGEFEWAGAFEMGAGTHTLTLSKVGGKYAADRMVLTMHKLRKGEKLGQGVLKASEGTFGHVAERASEEVELACKTSGAEMGTEDCPMHLSQGGVMDLSGLEPTPEPEHDDDHDDDDHEGHDHGEEGHEEEGHEEGEDHDDHDEEKEEDHDGHDHGRRDGHSTTEKVFMLEMDDTSPMTLFKIEVPEAGSYAIVTEHAISEFDGDAHYLKAPDGDNVRTLEEFPMVEECTDEGKLPMQQVWGYSIAGSLIGAAMSLSGALLILCAKRGEDFAASFANQHVVTAFAAGVLMGLVFIHLVPEAVSLNGGFDWVVSVCVVTGVFLGVATEHILHLLGFEHSHSGHAHARDDAKGACEVAAARDANASHRDTAMLSLPAQQFQSPYLAGPQFGWGPPQSVSGYSSSLGAPQMPVPPTAPSRPLTVSGGNFGSQTDSLKKDSDVEDAKPRGVSSIAINIFVGDFFHNLFDGVAIGSAFMSCGSLGWLVTASVVVHELPQEMSDFVILVKSGLSIPQALIANLLSSASSLIGVILVILIQQAGTNPETVNRDIGRMLAFSAGILLYVGMGLLVDLPRTGSLKSSAVSWLALLVGVTINGLLLLWHLHCDKCDAVGGGSHEGHDH